jgi:hypothetical protein
MYTPMPVSDPFLLAVCTEVASCTSTSLLPEDIFTTSATFSRAQTYTNVTDVLALVSGSSRWASICTAFTAGHFLWLLFHLNMISQFAWHSLREYKAKWKALISQRRSSFNSTSPLMQFMLH